MSAIIFNIGADNSQFQTVLRKTQALALGSVRATVIQPPFPRRPVRPNGYFSGCPPKANS